MMVICCMLTACNYLDVIPPTLIFEDTMKVKMQLKILFTLLWFYASLSGPL